MRVCNNFSVALAQKSCYNTVDMGRKVVTIGGKPFHSKLAPYESEVKELKASSASVRAIAAEMFARHGQCRRVVFADAWYQASQLS